MVDNLNQRNVRDAIKYGLGIEGLCEKYNCSRDELIRRIEFIYKDSRSIINKLEKSSKKISGVKVLSAAEKTAEVKNAVREALEVGVSEIPELGMATKTMTLAEYEQEFEKSEEFEALSGVELPAEPGPEATSEETPLEKLKREAAEKSRELMQLEADYGNTLNYHQAQVESLAALAELLETTREYFDKLLADFRQQTEEDKTYTEALGRVRKKINAKNAELGKIREQIHSLEVTTICLFETGEIKVFEGPEFEFDRRGAAEILAKMMGYRICEELRLKDLRALAEAIAIVTNSDRNVSLIVEDPAVAYVSEFLSCGASPYEELVARASEAAAS